MSGASTTRYRIAMVAACPFPFPRGTPIRIHRMAEALGRRGHEVHVVTYHLGETVDDSTFVTHRIDDVPAYRKTAPGPSYRKLLQIDRLLARLLARVLDAHDIDVVHAHHYEGLLVARLAGRRLRSVIYDAHTILESELPFYRLGMPRWLKRRIAVTLDRHLPRRADHTIAVTDVIRDALLDIAAVAPDRVTVISNGVESELFELEPRRRLAAASGPPTIVFAGNLAAYQGVDLLLRAFAELRTRIADARLRIVTGSSFEAHEALAESLGVRGWVDVERAAFSELPALLAGSDVAVSPRVSCDGIPQKLLNYMAAGLPVVAFEGSAALIRDEQTGLRVSNGDVEALASAIERVLGDATLAERLGDAAQRHVRAERSWDATARAIETVYERVLHNP